MRVWTGIRPIILFHSRASCLFPLFHLSSMVYLSFVASPSQCHCWAVLPSTIAVCCDAVCCLLDYSRRYVLICSPHVQETFFLILNTSRRFKRQEKTPVHATTNQTTTTNSTTNKALSTMAHSITLQSAKLRVSVGPAFDGEELTSRLHDIHDCNNATTGAPLKRHNALRWPGDDVVEVPKKEDVKGLRRTKAVRHRRTNTQESQDFANVRVAWKSDVDAGAKAKGTSSTYGSEKALPLRRKSRFVEHMAETDTKGPLTEDEAWETAATIRKKSRFIERVEQTDPQNFLRGVRIGHAMGSAAMKVVAGAKSALRRGVVCPRSGMGMYEGT